MTLFLVWEKRGWVIFILLFSIYLRVHSNIFEFDSMCVLEHKEESVVECERIVSGERQVGGEAARRVPAWVERTEGMCVWRGRG